MTDDGVPARKFGRRLETSLADLPLGKSLRSAPRMSAICARGLVSRGVFGLDPLDKPPKLYFVVVRQPPGVLFRCLVVDAIKAHGAQEMAVFIQYVGAISDHSPVPRLAKNM